MKGYKDPHLQELQNYHDSMNILPRHKAGAHQPTQDVRRSGSLAALKGTNRSSRGDSASKRGASLR